MFIISMFDDDNSAYDNSIPFNEVNDTFESALNFIKGFVIGRLVDYDNTVTYYPYDLDVRVEKNKYVTSNVWSISVLYDGWSFQFSVSEIG